MTTPKRTIGAMNIWEPPDKTFCKHTFNDGTGDLTPNVGSICTINLYAVGDHGDKMETDKMSLGGYKFGEDLDVTIGEGDTPMSDHFDQVFMSMKEGESAYIKSKLDSQGNKQPELDLKSKGVLKFNAHLKSFSRAADASELEKDEYLERAQHYKDRGTELFKENNLKYAIKRYKGALQYILDMEPVGELPDCLAKQHLTLKCQCYLNLAACGLKNENYDDVIENCTSALQTEPDNVKGLFRRGQAYVKLSKYNEAKEDFQMVIAMEPSNKAAINQLRTAEDFIKKEKQMYQKMFSS